MAKGAKIRVQGSSRRVTLRSYEQRSFIMCLHWICYLVVILDMCLMPLVVCAWWLFSYLDICDLWMISPCGSMDFPIGR